MKVLIIGGTGFIGPRVATQLIEAGHSVTLFHRGKTAADLPSGVNHIYGERRDLPGFATEFKRLAPDVVLDMICYNQREASDLMQTFKGIALRVVIASSMDVYKAYGLLLGLESGPPDPNPLNENSPLRESRFPYRAQAKTPEEMAFDYDKIPVEQVVMGDADLPVTVLRLPAVYGPGHHRAFDYLKRMTDGRKVILLEEKHSRWRWTRGYVANIAHGLVLAVTDDLAKGRVYNVGEPDALTEEEFVRSIGRAAGWQGRVIVVPDRLMPEHLRAPYNFDHHFDADTTRIRDELGYREKTSREQAMKETVEWERTHATEHVDRERFNYEAEDAVLAKL